MRVWSVVGTAMLLAMAAGARTVSTGTVVANPGATVSVPVTADDLSGVAAAVVVLSYDPTILVCLGADAGSAADAEKMTYVDSGSGRIVAVISGFVEGNGAGSGSPGAGRHAELFRIRFSVRDGTQGLFSDVTLSDVQLGAADGVSDLSAANPLSTANGMVRVMAADASVSKLEGAFTVWPGTALGALSLGVGDGIMAGESPIRIAGAVAADREVRVAAPAGGWRTGRYALLATATEGLAFELENDGSTGQANPPSWTVSFSCANGITTYYADVVVEGELSVALESGDLPSATVAQIREQCESALAGHPEVTRIVVRGDAAEIPVIADLGIAPQLDILGTDATATYSTPTLTITEFNPQTGLVRIKVTPGEGNSIRSALATGCIHVYGTSDLTEKMRYISGTAFDLSPYLKSETKGEAELTVSLGSHTFIKVKAETIIPKEGEKER